MYALKIIYSTLKGKWELLVMRLSNKRTQEQQKQAWLKNQLLFFEQTVSTSKQLL